MFQSLQSSQLIIMAGIFGLFATVAWLVLETLSAQKARAEERLDELSSPRMRRGDAPAKAKKKDAMSELWAKASPALARPLQPKTEAEVNQLKARLSSAGFRSEAAPGIFLSLKLASLIGGLFFVGMPILLLKGFNMQGYTYGIGGSLAMFFLPDIVLYILGKARKDAIFFSLPDALDLMVVCVEAGLGLDQAMRKVSDEMGAVYKVISEEFSLCNLHLQMGKPRGEVLHDLGIRTQVDDLRALASILIQADKFGTSIAQALRTQSESMRTRRRQMAEEKAAKTAVKLIFPLVIFIFPGIFVVLVGPAAITMVKEMFPAMSGAG